MRIALITEDRYLVGQSPDPLVGNVLADDREVQAALTAEGYTVKRVDWQDPAAPWSDCDAAILRSPWSYSEKVSAFRGFLERCAADCCLINPIDLVRWNLDKHYLIELGRAGVSVVKTWAFHRPESESPGIKATLAHLEGHEFVVKPAVSAGGRETHRISQASEASLIEHIDQLAQLEPLLIQPFQASILDRGEFSAVVIAGEYSHAIAKRARPGEFRVQDDHGGTIHSYRPSGAEIEFAVATVAACPKPPLYARVDYILDPKTQPQLMEIELIEPELWFRREPSAARRMASQLGKYIRGS